MRRIAVFLVALLALVAGLAQAAPGLTKVPDISNTKHNLSKTGPGTVKATSESQICVFCHTPHGAENVPGAPLWNRKLSGATYTTYSSSSIEASLTELSSGPGGLSRLCLSCHDGTMAIGSVNVLNGKANASIAMAGTTVDGKMPGGTLPDGSSAALSGFTRLIGTDLSNDHPISFTYNAAVALADGELRNPELRPAGSPVVVGTRIIGQPKPRLPLEGDKVDNGQLQCTTCHDPHLKETDATKGTGKFLRLNRLQEGTPNGNFDENNDIICLACHDKGGSTWALSVHANPSVADEQFKTNPASLREFPANLPVWRAACLSCHDTHTVPGARRLLREGTDTTGTAGVKVSGKSAIEETCYQCHTNSAETILNAATGVVPNIKDDFALKTHMPITGADQQKGGAEVHDIGTGDATLTQRGKDFLEDRKLLGKGDPTNRHVECTDCHNPHRIIKNRQFNDDPSTATAATHNHAAGHTNIASGVLKGSYGVEPVYTTANFGSIPTFNIKRGAPPITGASTAVGSSWVTREYQVCLKCHSTWAYDSPPALGESRGGTGSGTNGVTKFTDQSMEIQAPSTHRGETTTADSGAFKGQVRNNCTAIAPNNVCGSGTCSCYNVDFQANNHRGWHPVIGSTGRTLAVRQMTDTNATNAWRAPWNATADVGSQTMYCTDCHGSSTAADTVVPVSPAPWGPHGSSNNFLLKGEWSSGTGTDSNSSGGATANALCFKCHNPQNYADRNGLGSVSNRTSGFYNSGRGNLHAYHTDKIGHLRCSWCHIAVPHGWKNKAFLVNLNDVGAEGGLADGTQVRNNTKAGYTNGPYYNNAVLKVKTFATSGNWSDTNCGSAGAPGNGQTGKSWMRDSNEACGGMP